MCFSMASCKLNVQYYIESIFECVLLNTKIAEISPMIVTPLSTNLNTGHFSPWLVVFNNFFAHLDKTSTSPEDGQTNH